MLTELDIKFGALMVGLGAHLKQMTTRIDKHSVTTCKECYKLLSRLQEVKDEIDANRHL
jgi:hypothetical protein